MTKNNLPMPKVDFTRVGRKWTKTFGRLVIKADRIMRTLQSLAPENSSPEKIGEFEDMHDTYMDKLDAISDEQMAFISTVIVSVPQACLTSDAPSTEEIDWSEADSFDWVRQDVMVEFMTKLQTGELAKESAKN